LCLRDLKLAGDALSFDFRGLAQTLDLFNSLAGLIGLSLALFEILFNPGEPFSRHFCLGVAG
jgi:hypothetical protein